MKPNRITATNAQEFATSWKVTKTVMTHALRPVTLVIKIVLKLKKQRRVVMDCKENLSRNVTILLKSKVYNSQSMQIIVRACAFVKIVAQLQILL